MLLLILCKHPNPTVCGFSESGKKMSSVVAVRGREQLNEMLGFCNIEQDNGLLQAQFISLSSFIHKGPVLIK